MDTLKSFYSGFFKEFRDGWIGTPFWTCVLHAPKKFLGDFYWKHKYAFQRAWRGYDSVDVFNMDNNLRERFITLLKAFDKTRHTDFVSPNFNNDASVFGKPLSSKDSNKETSRIIEKMIYLAENSSEDDFLFTGEGWDFKATDVSFDDAYNMSKQNRDELFDMLKDYFVQLWD